MQKAADFSQRPVILTIVGNKTDLKDSREVFQADVDEFIAENHLNARYVESSAKDGSGVDDAFAWIAETVTSAPPPPPPASGSSQNASKDIELDVRNHDRKE
jgi:GTPase SAR1 family protein